MTKEQQAKVVDVDENTMPEPEAGAESDSTSISSSIRGYVYENGRRYHSFREGKYAIPNDELEQERLDIMHHIYTIMLDGQSTLAPLEKPTAILDIGTGTGLWALDLADRFPTAHVTGTDLSPIQPTWVPGNVTFLIDDAESDFTFPANSFDLIHTRGMIGSIVSWPVFLENIYQTLKPGGYVELFEMPEFRMFCDDGTYEGSALQKYYSSVEAASKKAGRSLSIEPEQNFAELVKEAGFVDLEITKRVLPLGTWPKGAKEKELGKWAKVSLESGFEAYGMALLTRVMGMAKEEVEKLIVDCKAEVKSRKIHCYCRINNYLARKPE